MKEFRLVQLCSWIKSSLIRTVSKCCGCALKMEITFVIDSFSSSNEAKCNCFVSLYINDDSCHFQFRYTSFNTQMSWSERKTKLKEEIKIGICHWHRHRQIIIMKTLNWIEPFCICHLCVSVCFPLDSAAQNDCFSLQCAAKFVFLSFSVEFIVPYFFSSTRQRAQSSSKEQQ